MFLIRLLYIPGLRGQYATERLCQRRSQDVEAVDC